MVGLHAELDVTNMLRLPADHVTTDEIDRFRTYAQYAGAAYCDHMTEGGEMFCNGDICPSKNATYSE